MSDLVKIQSGGIGFTDTKSKIFTIKPSTVELVQSMSKQQGALPGKFRVRSTGEHFDEMHVVLIAVPEEQRVYFEGGKFTPEARLCHSRDSIKPDDNAKQPQAMICASCPKQDWTKWKKAKASGVTNPELASYKPQCDKYWHVFLLDRKTKAPYFMNVRKTSIKLFEEAMQGLSSMAAVERANGKNPNLFDFSLKMKPFKKDGESYYNIRFFDIALMADEDRAEFGGVYSQMAQARAEAAAAGIPEDEEGSDFGEAPSQSTPALTGQDVTI